MPVDISGGHSIGLERNGVAIKGIRRVSGLKMEQDVIELKEHGPDGKHVMKRLPGGWKPGEVTVTRGLSKDSAFESWVGASRTGGGTDAGNEVAILFFDRTGVPVKRYELVNAWPRSLEIVLPEAGDTTALIEELVITYERLQVG